jgi:hypothetical protein
LIQGKLKIFIFKNKFNSPKLKESLLRPIEKYEWKITPNIDDKGMKKCVELDGFKFVYLDYQGKIHDMRPRENIPSYNNFINKSERELYDLLLLALRNQLYTLETEEKYSRGDYEEIEKLKEELKLTETNYKRISK